ncbi:hypothetical protein ALP26_04070 [Pseudomonas savastanoi pv. glycinea]|nr:hypothetical protein ALP26_04070 [Pseudomonas savastanoi pv. glycinea]
MYCRRVTRSLVNWELSEVMSLIQLLRLISPLMLVQPVSARIAVKTSTRPKPRASFILTLMFANQLLIEFSNNSHLKAVEPLKGMAYRSGGNGVVYRHYRQVVAKLK